MSPAGGAIWHWLAPLLRAAMELEHAIEAAPRERPLRIRALGPHELRLWGVLALRAQGRN